MALVRGNGWFEAGETDPKIGFGPFARVLLKRRGRDDKDGADCGEQFGLWSAINVVNRERKRSGSRKLR